MAFPGTLEHTLLYLIDHEIDLTGFDAGNHSEANLKALASRGIAALVADNGLRRRDK